MKDRLKYVIDSRYFDGTCLTSMSDGFHNDYGEETIEELRIRENNPYLKAVTPSDIDKKLRLYNQSLSEPFKEITEEDYYDLLDVLPPLRMRQNSFFVWKSHATLTLLAKQDLPTFVYNMIDPLKSWCWGSILFYPFKISRFS